MLGLLATALGAVAPAHADGAPSRLEVDAPSSEQRQAAPPPASGGVVMVKPTDEQAPAGPGVEIISGGNSADGVAKVGRLPVLE